MAQKTFAGRTVPGETHWHDFSTNVIYVDVDTSAGHFSGSPVYVTSLGGNAEHAQVVGVTSLYPPGGSTSPHGPTATGFRVYVNYYAPNRKLTAAIANAGFWHINWIGVEI